MIIKTKNLIIRNFQEKDAVGLLEYLSHPRVNCFADDRLYSGSVRKPCGYVMLIRASELSLRKIKKITIQ